MRVGIATNVVLMAVISTYDGGYVGGDAGSAEDGGHGDDSDGSCDDDDTKDENSECSDVYNRGASFT